MMPIIIMVLLCVEVMVGTSLSLTLFVSVAASFAVLVEVRFGGPCNTWSTKYGATRLLNMVIKGRIVA